VVVDDGSSDPAAARAVDAARDLGCTVLRHPTNRGKGVALRTGFRHVAEAHPGQDVVYADFDGQHSVADVLRVAERTRTTGRMVLGVRRLTARSRLRRVGNAVTRVLFRAVTGCAVRDTQTGLRAHPADQLDWLLSVSGDHFDYEMAVLLEATRVGLSIEQTTIATHSVNGNSSSHFSSLVDSARVYAPLLRFAVSRLSGSLRTRAATSSAAVRPVVPPEG
jgi:glycosyltransferase involved in cell wall biosynthesis